MKKLLSCLLVVAMMLTLVAAFAACGGEEKGTEAKTEAKTDAKTEAQTEKQTEAQTEKQTEAQTEKQTEAQTEKQTEAQTEKQTEAQTEKQTESVSKAPVTLPENTYVCEMQLNSYYVERNVPADVSSIVDAWPSHDEGYDRGLTFMMSDNDIGYFDECVKKSGNGATWVVLDAGYTVNMADPEKCFIYNGEIGDADFGTKVAGTVKDVFNGCICSAVDTVGPYVWVGNLWAYSDEQAIPDGFYTFVIYNDDGSAVAFTEWVVPSFYEHTYYYYWQ